MNTSSDTEDYNSDEDSFLEEEDNDLLGIY